MTDNSRLEKAITHITSRITQRPAVAVVLGSGLGDFANRVVDPIEITASSIPSYPISSVAGHEGSTVVVVLNSLRLLFTSAGGSTTQVGTD